MNDFSEGEFDDDEFETDLEFLNQQIASLGVKWSEDPSNQTAFDDFLKKYLPSNPRGERDFWRNQREIPQHLWSTDTAKAWNEFNMARNRDHGLDALIAEVYDLHNSIKVEMESRFFLLCDQFAEDSLIGQALTEFNQSIFDLEADIKWFKKSSMRATFETFCTNWTGDDRIPELPEELLSGIKERLQKLRETLDRREEIKEREEFWAEQAQFEELSQDRSIGRKRDLNREALSDEERLSIVLSAACGVWPNGYSGLLLSSLTPAELKRYHERKEIYTYTTTGSWHNF
jgi:hypothetical protein